MGKNYSWSQRRPRPSGAYPYPIFYILYDDIQEYMAKLYGIEKGDRIFYFTKSALDKESMSSPRQKNYFLPSNSCNSSILSRKWHSTGERIFSCFFRYFSYSPCAFSTACLWVILPFVVKISLLVIFR